MTSKQKTNEHQLWTMEMLPAESIWYGSWVCQQLHYWLALQWWSNNLDVESLSSRSLIFICTCISDNLSVHSWIGFHSASTLWSYASCIFEHADINIGWYLFCSLLCPGSNFATTSCSLQLFVLVLVPSEKNCWHVIYFIDSEGGHWISIVELEKNKTNELGHLHYSCKLLV